ncbi:unnamed protein product [Caenorhabditis brenneri]
MDHAKSQSGIQVHLADKSLWQKFYPKTEMIITKRTGRLLFPHLEYKIRGLQEQSLYQIYLYLERIDNIKYKYMSGKWNELSKGDPILPIRYKEHPHGIRPGSHWMNDPVSFAHLRLTNDPDNCDMKLIAVQSLHKFRPVVRIKRVDAAEAEDFRIHLTEFMAVTTYQDGAIVKLKIAHNKFASGFRMFGEKKKDDEEQPIHPIPSGVFNGYPMPVTLNQFFPVWPVNNYFWKPQNSVDTPKRLSLSSGSDISTPGTVTPKMKDEQYDTPSPIGFDQNGFVRFPQNPPSPFPMQNSGDPASWN